MSMGTPPQGSELENVMVIFSSPLPPPPPPHPQTTQKAARGGIDTFFSFFFWKVKFRILQHKADTIANSKVYHQKKYHFTSI